MKEKKFPVMLKNAVFESLETIVLAIFSTVAALAIFSAIFGPIAGLLMVGWWPAAIIWGILAAVGFTVVTQHGDQLIWCWKEDHKK